MKTIAVICAMKEEAASLIDALSLRESKSICGGSAALHEGEYCGKRIVVTVCGVGKVNAAMVCQSLVLLYAPDAVVNLGIAGGIAEGVKTGDICIATGFVQYDYDLSAMGSPKGLVDAFDAVVLPAAGPLTDDLQAAASECGLSAAVHNGIIATGDRFVSSSALAGEIVRQFGAVCCEMEGAAIAQVCSLNHVDCCAIRSISDNANENAPYDFEMMKQRAIKNSTAIMLSFLER